MNQNISPTEVSQSGRYHLLDTLRGITMLSMILYHFLWDLVYLADISIPWYHSTGAYIWQQSICITFILLSGFCWSFGRRPLKRGLIVFWAGGLITLVTMALMPDNLVLFGVLTLIGSCMILMIPLDHVLKKADKLSIYILLTAITLIIFLIFHPARHGYTELTQGNLFTAYLGFPGKTFYSTDYFPLLPWALLFVTGYLLHKISVCKSWLDFSLFREEIRPLSFIGRHSLFIYLLHQPILYGITILIINIKK